MSIIRLSDVASYPISDGTLHKVFTNGQDFTPELEDIGKEIARGCRGLPLVVVLVAGILPTIAKIRVS
ncbi:hypothetical protein ACS0TY_023730 [Phlomoides rotata]